MDGRATTKTFRLAPMSSIILSITIVLLMLPFGFLVAAMSGIRIHVVPCSIVLALYVWVWLRFRPSSFVVTDKSLDIVWPLKRQEIPRETISTVRLLDREELKQEIGWSMRVGAGGLGGGFGWLWTKRHGIVHMYVSRTDRFVWIERQHDRPWLLTPEQPDMFLQALSS